MTRERDCARFLSYLDAYLEGGLDRPSREGAEAHLGCCPECAETVTLVHGAIVRDEPPVGLAEEVLRRTTGGVCGEARARLGEDVADGHARLHAASCDACTPLVRALDRLPRDLPGLAEADPGPGFVRAVMSRTAASPAARSRRRLAATWSALVRRPRFALEFSYAVVAVAVVGFAVGDARPSTAFPRALRAGAAIGTEAAGRAGTGLGGWIRDAGLGLGRAVSDAFDLDTDDDAEAGTDRPAGGADDERN